MSGLTGKTKTESGTPEELLPIRGKISDYLIGQNLGSFLGMDKQSLDISPYRAMFAANRDQALAQAKESAGNLTGSGYGDALGRAAGQSALEENSFLAQLLEQTRQAKYNRAASLLGGFSMSGVGAPQTVYQPGFLDSVIGAGTSIATAYAGRPSGGGSK